MPSYWIIMYVKYPFHLYNIFVQKYIHMNKYIYIYIYYTHVIIILLINKNMYILAMNNVLIDYWSLAPLLWVKEIPTHNELIEHKIAYPFLGTFCRFPSIIFLSFELEQLYCLKKTMMLQVMNCFFISTRLGYFPACEIPFIWLKQIWLWVLKQLIVWKI